MACSRIPKAALWAALCLGVHTSAQPATATSNANPLCDLGSWDANRLEMCTQWEQAGHGCSTQWFQVCSAEHPWGNNVTLDQGCPERCLQSGEGPAANPTAALFTLPTSTGGFGALWDRTLRFDLGYAADGESWACAATRCDAAYARGQWPLDYVSLVSAHTAGGRS